METPHVLNFKVHETAQPRYRYLRLSLNNRNGNITLRNARELLEFKLPSVPFNLARSKLSYGLKVPKPNPLSKSGVDASGNLVDPYFIWTYEDLSFGEICDSISFGNASGVKLCDLQYDENYIKIATRAFTNAEELFSRDVVDSVYDSNLITGDNIIPGGLTMAANNVYERASGNYFNEDLSSFSIRSSFVSSPDTQVTRSRCLTFSDIKNTVFSEDRDQYFPTEMYVRIDTRPVSKIAFQSTDEDDPSKDTKAFPEIELQNVYLHLAVQVNQDICDSLIESVRSNNHKYRIPFTTTWRNSLNVGINTANIQITSQYGKQLKHVMWCLGSDDEQLNHAVDTQNFNGDRIEDYMTYMDNRQLFDSRISCKQPLMTGDGGLGADDWRENSKHCANKSLNYPLYQINFFHMDSFVDEKTNEGLDLTDTNISGALELEAVRLYAINANVKKACTLYTYGTFYRDVMIDNTGNILFG